MSEEEKINLVNGGLLTVKEAAAMAKLSRATLYLVMDRGEPKYCKLGKSRRIPRNALMEYLASNLVGGWAG